MKCIFMDFVKIARNKGLHVKIKINIKLNCLVAALICVILMAPKVDAVEKIKIVTTIGQITDVVNEIGGQYVDVDGLMGAGVDPHLYKASESDVSKLSNAQIIIYLGLHLEAKMADLFKKMARYKKTVAVSDSIGENHLLASEAFKDQYDPHIWFDVLLWINVADTITNALADFDPEHQEYYKKNSEEYKIKLNGLHNYVQKKSQELAEKDRVLVTAHDAFRYFGRAYDFRVIGLQGISTESKAGTKDVIVLADFIVKNKIRAMFVESSVPVRNIKAVQEAVKSRGWDVKIGGELFSDALGDKDSFEGTYIGMVTHNIDVIVEALRE